VKGKHDSNKPVKAPDQAPRSGSLKVLIIGEPESLDHSSEILDTLLVMGVGFTLLGVIDKGLDDLARFKEAESENPMLVAFKDLLVSEPPDLLIMNSDDAELRKSITEIIPAQTRILDTFALKIIKKLREVSAHLDVTRNRLESVEMIKEVLMSGPETSIMVVDEDLNLVEISSALLKRAKMSKQDAIDKACYWVVRKAMEPCDVRGRPCIVRDALKTGRSVHTVREDQNKDESNRYFTVSAYPLRKDEKGKKNVLVVWKDVTRAMAPVLDRQAQTIREDFSQVLTQDRMVALGKLASAAVHEINNPLQGILTFAKLMRQSLNQESVSPEELDRFRSYLDLIADESARCGKILRNLLSFSRRGELTKASVDITALSNEVVLLLGHRMELEKVTFNRDIPENLPPVRGDRDQIKQGLLNLVLNSVEAMPDGGVVEISAALHPDGKQVTVSIKDTGVGIPEEVQSNIFEPFFTTKAEGKGVGLGLSVVYGIIAQHGGAIEVDSHEGEGATFIFTLPVFDESSIEEAVDLT